MEAKKVPAQRSRRRGYSAEQKRAVLRDARSIGVCVAARKHGVPASCVSRWLAMLVGGHGVGPGSGLPESTPARRSTGATAATAPSVPGRNGPVPATVEPSLKPRKKAIAKSYTPSQRAEILEGAAKESITAASIKFGVSRYSIYEWKRRAEAAAQGKGESPTTGPARVDVEEQRDKELLNEWHRHPGLGPSQIKNQLRRRGVKVSVQTARRVMEEAGYRPPKVKRKPHDERFDAVRPNHLWHLDFLHRNINRASTFTLILLDDCSRYVVGHGVDDAERANLVIETFERAVERHGKPEMVLHDKGSAFWSWRGISRFSALLEELGVDQIPAEHKEWNGKVEVFNANIQKELFDVQRFYDVAEMRRRLASHLHWYNHERTHHALGGLLVPADRFYGRTEEVLARIESGAGRDLGDDLDLRKRGLELFKVVTEGGVPEVWLMGKKILELRN